MLVVVCGVGVFGCGLIGVCVWVISVLCCCVRCFVCLISYGVGLEGVVGDLGVGVLVVGVMIDGVVVVGVFVLFDGECVFVLCVLVFVLNIDENMFGSLFLLVVYGLMVGCGVMFGCDMMFGMVVVGMDFGMCDVVMCGCVVGGVIVVRFELVSVMILMLLLLSVWFDSMIVLVLSVLCMR